MELILCYKSRGRRNEVRVSFYQDRGLSCIPLNPRFAFARIVAQAGRYEKGVADSETKQGRKKLVSKSHIIIPPLYFELLQYNILETCCCGDDLLIADRSDLMWIMIIEKSDQSILAELDDPIIFVICYKQ